MALISSLSFLSKAQFEQLNVGKFYESRGGVSPRQRDCKRNVHDVALVGGSARIPIVQKMFQVGGLVFNAHGNRFAKELSRRDYVTGEMWRSKPPFRLALNRTGSDCVA